MEKGEKLKYRHEWKHEINHGDLLVLRLELHPIPLDGYFIRDAAMQGQPVFKSDAFKRFIPGRKNQRPLR